MDNLEKISVKSVFGPFGGFVIVFVILLLCSTVIARIDPVPPTLCTEAAPYDINSPIVSTTVFQWFTSDGGQLSGPWQPVEGRETWTGESDWWQSQIKQMMLANIDVLYVHTVKMVDPDWYAPLRRKFLTALGQMRADGYDVPKVVPWLDIVGNPTPFDVSTEAGKDGFVGEYIAFFNDYFETNPVLYKDSYLAQIDGRVVLNLYHTAGGLINPGSLTRQDVESRLAAEFGADHPMFNNGIYLIGNANAYLTFSDELVHQFMIAYYAEVTHNGITAARVAGGY